MFDLLNASTTVCYAGLSPNLYWIPFFPFNPKVCTDKTQNIFEYRKVPLANNSSLHLQSRKVSWLEETVSSPSHGASLRNGTPASASNKQVEAMVLELHW